MRRRISPTSRLLLFTFASILQSTSAQQQCYQPDGSLFVADTACDSSASGSTCCGDGWVCLSDGVCELTQVVQGRNATFYYRGTCTDQSWDDPGCLNICRDGTEGIQGTSDNTSLALVKCARGDGKDFYCCTNDPDCNCDQQSGNVFSLGATDPFTVTKIGATTWENSVTSAIPKSTVKITAPNEATTTARSTKSTTTTSSAGGAAASTSPSTSSLPSTSGAGTSSGTGTAVPGSSTSQPDAANSSGGSDSNRSLALGLGIGLGVAALLILLLAFFLIRSRRRKANSASAGAQHEPLTGGSSLSAMSQTPYSDGNNNNTAAGSKWSHQGMSPYQSELPGHGTANERYEADGGAKPFADHASPHSRVRAELP